MSPHYSCCSMSRVPGAARGCPGCICEEVGKEINEHVDSAIQPFLRFARAIRRVSKELPLDQVEDGSPTEEESAEGVLSMALARLGGQVRGHPTGRHNLLGRIDQLRMIEEAYDITGRLSDHPGDPRQAPWFEEAFARLQELIPQIEASKGGKS